MSFVSMKLPLLLLVSLLIAACATAPKPIPKPFNPHKNPSYTLRAHNRTYAVYNNDHRLISHPIEDLLAEMKWRKATGGHRITDIYVMAHGWNFTLPVSIANYNSYMQEVDNFYNLHRQEIDAACKALDDDDKKLQLKDAEKQVYSDKCFQPYFIFITWTSTVRPLTDIVNAVLPFGIDAAIRPVTSLMDKIPGHIVTVWKESLNATQNALGSRYANHYLGKEWINSEYGYRDDNFIEDSDSSMGEDIPVSALIYKLIQMKNPFAKKVLGEIECDQPDSNNKMKCHKPGNLDAVIVDCNTPDPLLPISDNCVALDKTKIHLAGHSFGAKLIALAGMESIRRWMLDELCIDCSKLDETNSKNNKDLLKETGHSFKLPLPTPLQLDDKKPQKLQELYNRPYKKPPLHEALAWEQSEPPLQSNKNCFNKEHTFIPIDSLTLFNPAFLPQELNYHVNEFLLSAPIDTLRFIPRKAIIYSNNDFANGGLFAIHDMLLNTEVAQVYQPLSNEFSWLSNESIEDANSVLKPFLYSLKSAYLGSVGIYDLAVAIGYGPIIYGTTNLSNIHHDYWHHIKTHKLFGGKLDENTSSPMKIVSYLSNPVDYFLPPIFEKEETQQGFFRLNRPALGKTGLNNRTEDRIAWLNLADLAPYYTETKTFGDDKPAENSNETHPFAPNIDAMTFCRFASSDPFSPNNKALDYQASELRSLREKFYSFDASRVYDSKGNPLVGAHGDLRETEPPSEDDCWNVLPNGQRMDKRDYTFTFLYNFTKTNFEKTLDKLAATAGNGEQGRNTGQTVANDKP